MHCAVMKGLVVSTEVSLKRSRVLVHSVVLASAELLRKGCALQCSIYMM